MISSLILGSIFLVLGVTVGTLGIISFSQARTRMKEWHRTEGIIVGPITNFRNDTEDPEYPIIEFRDSTGQVYTFKSDWTMSGLPRPGSKVQVLYNPMNPKDAIYHTEYSTYFIPILLILGGITMLRVAFYYFFSI